MYTNVIYICLCLNIYRYINFISEYLFINKYSEIKLYMLIMFLDT